MTIPAHVLIALKEGSPAAARIVAREYRDGHHMRGLADGHEWGTSGLIEDVDNAVMGMAKESMERIELEALRAWALMHTAITSVDSSHGHRFIGGDDRQECLSCGASYEQVHDDPEYVAHGRYRTWNGDDPIECPDTPHEEYSGCNDLICTG